MTVIRKTPWIDRYDLEHVVDLIYGPSANAETQERGRAYVCSLPEELGDEFISGDSFMSGLLVVVCTQV